MHGSTVCLEIGQRGIWTYLIGSVYAVSGFCPLRPFSSTARLLFLTPSCQSAADSFPQRPAKKK